MVHRIVLLLALLVLLRRRWWRRWWLGRQIKILYINRRDLIRNSRAVAHIDRCGSISNNNRGYTAVNNHTVGLRIHILMDNVPIDFPRIVRSKMNSVLLTRIIQSILMA